MADDGTIDGLTEDELIDDAELDTLVRETVTQVNDCCYHAFTVLEIDQLSVYEWFVVAGRSRY